MPKRDDRRFAALARAHFDALYRFAVRLERDPVAAEDLVQDALCRGLGRIDQLHDSDAFRPWMCRIVYRTWLNRRAPRPDAWLHAFAEGDREARLVSLPPPDVRVEVLGLAGQLRDALDELPEAQRAAVWLVDGLGFTFAEAAEVLETRPGTVASRVARGRAALRIELGAVAAAWGIA